MDHTLSRAEISRITVSSEHRTFKKTTKILQTMQEELCRFAVDSGIQQLIGAVEPAFLRLLNCAMLAYKPFGPLQYHIGAKRYPVFFSVQNCNSTAQECS
jgi:N-acyl-L-homoserine lactone synthetase